jgi:serine/threonine protein phosphatase PrpC
MKHFVKSIPCKGKRKNGDTFLFYENKSLIIAIVADGVGGKPFDWKASRQVCDDFLDFFVQDDSNSNILAKLNISLEKTFSKLYSTNDEHKGMLSTLVSLVIDKVKHEYYHVCVGDSEILKFENDEITKLTSPTEFVVPRNQLLEMAQFGGFFKSKTSFALMTDGFTENRKNYKNELGFIIEKEGFEHHFESLFSLNQLTQFDDMTLMIIKN